MIGNVYRQETEKEERCVVNYRPYHHLAEASSYSKKIYGDEYGDEG
jgi:hypothetical protein